MRIAFKMKLRPGCQAEYKRRHDRLWPELRSLIKNAGITNYTIFHDPETNYLFAVQEIMGSGTSQDLGTEDVVKKWWAYMADIMETMPDNSPVTSSLNELFHLD
jgi:L-rhamnose mutarotase